jgi:hypothetical protein
MLEGRLPVGDVMLAQKLALELFEAKAIKVAHMSPSIALSLAVAMARRARHDFPRR